MTKRLIKTNKVALFALILVTSSCYLVDRQPTVRNPDDLQINGTALIQADKSKEILEKLNKIFSASPEVALSIVKKEINLSANDNNSLIVCDDGLSWRVIYTNERKEFYVSKISNKVILPVIKLENNISELAGSEDIIVSAAKAFDISKKHFIGFSKNKYNATPDIVSGYFPSVCDLGDSWRVYFVPYELNNIRASVDVKKLSNDHPPDYIVDKKTGNIIYFNFAE